MGLGGLLVALACLGGDPHAENNALYRELTGGSLVVAGTRIGLPQPVMADGLDPAAQQAVLDRLPGRRVPVSELVRDSISAPFVLAIGEVRATDGGLPVRAVDVYFVVFGDPERLREKDRSSFLGPEARKAHRLAPEELARRGIELSEEKGQSAGFIHGTSSVMDRVELATTSLYRSTSHAGESAVVATLLDPRFADDAEYPNRWRAMARAGDGTLRLGPPQPYQVSASYLKATRLIQPAGASLVEIHILFEQPAGWFGGHDLLRSKLPLAMQTAIRRIRKEVQDAQAVR